jgi:flagellar hook assembly protein FlgD
MSKRIIYFMLALLFILSSCTSVDSIFSTMKDGKIVDADEAPFILDQNFPNPFNPQTSIRYDLSKSMDVSLKVYTEDWQSIKTLIESSQSAGLYSVVFNGMDENDQPLPSGEYIYMMEAEGYTQIRKMRILK